MRTSIELPDPLFRDAKTLAVSRGLTFKALVNESLARTVAEQMREAQAPRWKRHIGTLNSDAADEVERRLREIDREAIRVQNLTADAQA